jgi:hypothetical protein
MLLLPERAARAVVVRAGGLVAGFSGLTAAAMAALGTLGMQTHAYLGMLAAETSAGSSMSAASREVMPVASEITSLESILGFWIANPMVRIALTCLLLAGLGLLALRQTRRVDSERGALLAVGAWCSLGMLATYHRAHDATLLLLLAPWVVDRVRRSPHAWHAWATAALYCAVSASAAFPMVARWVSAAPVYADTPSGRMIVRWVSAAPAHSPTAFILLRQAGLADLLLLLVLLLAMEREHAHQAARSLEIAEADEVEAAA